MSSKTLLKGGAVVACVAASYGLSPYIDRAAALITGDAVEPLNVTDGPTPAWTDDLPDDFTTLELQSDGTILLLADGKLVGLRDGTRVFELEADEYGWVATAPTPDEPSILPTPSGFVGVAVDGAIAFEVTLPPSSDAEPESDEDADADEDPEADKDHESETEGDAESDTDDDDELEEWRVEASRVGAKTIVRVADEWIVGDAEARFFRFSAPACAQDPLTCLRPIGRLEGETLDNDAKLQVADGELILLREDDVLRAFTPELTQRWELRAKDSLGHVHLSEERPLRVTALVDDDLIVLDPGSCDAPRFFAPSSYPQKGRLVISEACDPEWEDCSSPGPTPSGCVVSQTYIEEVDAAAFAVLPNGTVVLNGEETAAMLDGERLWQHQLYASGDAFVVPSGVFLASVSDDDDEPMHLWSIGHDGEVGWKSELPAVVDGWIYSLDDVVLRVAGDFVVAGNREHVAVFEIER